MIQKITRFLRLYFIQAWFSYRALSVWNTPFTYLVSKLGFPFFTMLLFVFMGKFIGMADPVYIVIGNILLYPSTYCISGVSQTIANERFFGALSSLLGSPAPRAPLFLGRALTHILDGIATVIVALAIAIPIFHLDIHQTHPGLVFLCILITTLTTSGIGFLMGSIYLISRDGWMITSTLSIGLYILVGVNFPIDLLPPALKVISYGLPMTRGILATRMALAGAAWGNIAPLLLGEILVGALYGIAGYALFWWMEKRSLVTGSLDHL
jgi:ABC-2 type transport system permease protein